MKKFHFPVLTLFAALAVLFASCGRDVSMSDILDRYVSDDADMILAGDLRKAVEATGSRIENGKPVLSPSLESLLDILPNSIRNSVHAILECDGLDWESAVATVKIDGLAVNALVAVTVADEGKFAACLHEQAGFGDVEKIDGWTAVENGQTGVVARDNLAFLVVDNSGPVKAMGAIAFVKECGEQAAKAPLPAWKKSRLVEGKVLSCYLRGRVIANVYEGFGGAAGLASAGFYGNDREYVELLKKSNIFFSLDFQGPSLRLASYCCDDEGRDIDVPVRKEINGKLAAYAGPEDILAFAAGDSRLLVEAYGKALDAVATNDLSRSMVDNVLRTMDGTLFVSWGVKNASYFSSQSVADMHFTVAAEYSDGAAPRALDALASLMNKQKSMKIEYQPGESCVVSFIVGYEDSGDSYFSIYEDESDPVPVVMDLHMKVEGDVLVVSNSPVDAGRSPFPESAFNGYALALDADLAKGGAVLGLLNAPFGVKLESWMKKADGEAVLTLTDTDKPFLVALSDFVGSAIR